MGKATEGIDVLIRQETNGKKRLRDSFYAMMSWLGKWGRAFRLDELPGLIGKLVGIDEKEIKAIVAKLDVLTVHARLISEINIHAVLAAERRNVYRNLAS